MMEISEEQTDHSRQLGRLELKLEAMEWKNVDLRKDVEELRAIRRGRTY
jgi:hypothetical protein